MRGLYVVNNPAFGGGQGQFLRLQSELAGRGWDFRAATPPGEVADRLRAGGLKVDTLDLHRLRATADPRDQAALLVSLPREVATLRRLIRRRRIDLVQVHGDVNPHGAIAGRLEGIGVVWQLYDTRTPRSLRRVTMPVVTRLADVVTTWGERLGHEYPGTVRLGERWLSVFPPVDGEEFKPDALRRASGRVALALRDTEVAVAMVAMLNRQKGHDSFVRALALARDRRPELVGRILGGSNPGHLDYELRVRAEAQRLGLLNGRALDILDAGSRVPALLPAFDVLVLSSVARSEGMPTVILEAMACGIPVVATDVGAVRELVVDGQTGLVVAPGDDTALAAALVRLSKDTAARESMGEAGRRRFEERFQLGQLADRHARAYALALRHRSSRAQSGLRGRLRRGTL